MIQKYPFSCTPVQLPVAIPRNPLQKTKSTQAGSHQSSFPVSPLKVPHFSQLKWMTGLFRLGFTSFSYFWVWDVSNGCVDEVSPREPFLQNGNEQERKVLKACNKLSNLRHTPLISSFREFFSVSGSIGLITRGYNLNQIKLNGNLAYKGKSEKTITTINGLWKI